MSDFFDLDVATLSIDSDSECSRSISSLNAERKWQLSRLSRAKLSIALNNVRHLRLNQDNNQSAQATVYAIDVFLHKELRGIKKHNHKEATPNHKVVHRYSMFRALRERIGEAVAKPKGKSHPQWCPYCSRVRELVRSNAFPPRFPARVAIATGLHDYLMRSREERLETFMNLLLRAAKDISYRSGCTPCGRFEVVSRLLSDFLSN